MKRKHFLFITLLLSVMGLYAFEPVPTEQLLLSYLQNDIDLQKLTLTAEKAALSYDSSKIDNGINVNISSGAITFKTSKEGLSVKAAPSVKMTIPQAANLSVSAQGTFTPTNSENIMSDTTLSVGVDIISPEAKNRDINNLTAERNRDIAIRNLEIKAIEKEKAFYSELKDLLNSLNTIIQSQKKLYTDMKDFEAVQARGFSKDSSTYRTSELQVLTDKNTIESQIKAFVNDYLIFYKKCMNEIVMPAGFDFMALIPTDIPKVEPVNVEDFPQELFIELENANWNHKINSMKRDANGNFSLSASTGYTFDNSLTKSDTVNMGINSTIGGVNLNAGVNIPVQENPYPSFTLSATVTPNTFRKNNIKNKQDDLTEQQELLDIKIAENNYDNFVLSSKQTLDQLLWRIETTKKNYEMYQDLKEDMKVWYEQGVVSESEYLNAITNANMYKVKMAINDIDLIIYNNDILRKFIPTENN